MLIFDKKWSIFLKQQWSFFNALLKYIKSLSFFDFFLLFPDFFLSSFLFHLIKKKYQEVLAEEIASVEHGYFHASHTEGFGSNHLCSWGRGIISGRELVQGNSQGGSPLQWGLFPSDAMEDPTSPFTELDRDLGL